MKKGINLLSTSLFTVLALLFYSSCTEELPDKIVKAGAISISVSTDSLQLQQKFAETRAIALTWSTGTNHETGASIDYTLKIDKKGNNFSNSITYNLGKGIYTKSFKVGELNDSLLTHWGITPGSDVELDVKVIATVNSTPAATDQSNVLLVKVKTYKPVTKSLYIYGTASPKGTDLNLALRMTPQTDPTIFVYQGALAIGSLKLLTTLGQELPSYNKGADASTLILRSASNQADDQFSTTEAGVYRIEASLLDLKITISKINYPAYGEVYLYGTAAPNGTDIANATPLTQNATNPFVFTYRGVLKAGDFKFPINKNTDLAQDMFERVDDTQFTIHSGGTTGDSRWSISKKGYYTLTLNQMDNTITIYREKLYMVGNATSIGWTITNAIQMTEDATDGCIFTYSGPMVSGDFKLPVNRNSDWGQDMYMRTDDTHMYRHIGGQADDKKWTITTSGNYVITANLETLGFSFIKQ